MIRFGMKLPEIFAQLVRGYRKVTGRDPEGLDLIKIRQESKRRFEEMNKVVDMQGRSIDTSKGIMGGKQIEDVIDDLPPPGSRGGPDDIAAPVMNVEDAPPGFIDFVRRTDPKGADKLQKVEDEIKAAIEAANKRAAKKLRNKKKKKDDPEKKADGGRIGYSIGDQVIPNNDFMNLGLGNITQDQNTQTAFSLNPLDLFKDTPEEKALEQIEDLRKQENQIKGLGEGAIELKQDELQDIQKQIQNLKQQFPEDEGIQQAFDPYADIQGQTAFLDPFTVIGGIAKVAKGAKASALAKEFFKQKAKQKISKEVYDKIQKKIKTPKYPPGPIIKTGSGSDKSGGGYQSNFSQDRGFMEGKGTAAEMGSFADGGRIGLKDGMNRRSFLKIMGGLAAIPVVGKFFKLAKTAKGIKSVPIVETAEVAGKPAWFDALVNKVIREGDDFTKELATGERQVVHVKKLDEDATVTVTQDMDQGAVRVEYDSSANTFGDTVSLQYKKPLPDEGAPNPRAEFEVAESGPVSRQVAPDDYDIDIDEVGGTSIKDLDSDVSKLKEYATGKKPTMKEIVQNKKRKDKADNITEDQEAQMDAIIRRQGEYDGPYDDDFASGGIARMLGE
jgi:hypothetical protein